MMGDNTMLKRMILKTLLLGMFAFSFLAISGCMRSEANPRAFAGDDTHEGHETGVHSHTID